ncbi:hypothetical protein ACOSP7_018946 [Xanthoceras sorbifolium]
MVGLLGLLDVDEALKRVKERKKNVVAKKATSIVVDVEKIKTPLPPPFTSRAKSRIELPSVGQKRHRKDYASEGELSVALPFPADASTYSNFGAIVLKKRSMLRRLPRSSPSHKRSRSYNQMLLLTFLVLSLG